MIDDGMSPHLPEEEGKEQADNTLSDSCLPKEQEQGKDQSPEELSNELRLRLGEHAYLSEEAAPTSLKPAWPITHLHTPKQLEKLVLKLKRVSRFSIDTETWGPKVLSDELCLIQISIPPEELHGRTRAMTKGMGQTFLIDVVKLDAHAVKDGKGRNSLEPLRQVFEDEKIAKIVHHAQFEKAQFEKYGLGLAGVVDTERLAKYMRPDLKSYSLQACVLELMGVEMSKEEQTSRWIQRPLTEEQIAYAALDAEVVIHLHDKLAAIDKRMTPRYSMGLSTLIKGVSEAQVGKEKLLGRPEIRDALALLDAQASACRERLTEMLLTDAEEGITDNYRGAYGIASQRQLPIEKANINLLRELLPDLAQKTIQQKTTKTALKAALEDLERGSELNEIWNAINTDTGELSQPRLSLSLNNVSAEREAAPFPIARDVSLLSKSELMEALLEAELGQLQVIRSFGLGDELAALEAKTQKYSERILERLVELADGSPTVNYKCPHGIARLSSRARKKIDIAKLQEEYPEVAEKCVSEHLTKTSFIAALRSVGAEPKTAQAMVKEIFIPTGEITNPRVSIRPNYGLFYKGIGLPPEEESNVYGDVIDEDM